MVVGLPGKKHIWGAVKIYYNGLVCFWRVIVFWGGPYRFTGFCCFRHHPSRSKVIEVVGVVVIVVVEAATAAAAGGGVVVGVEVVVALAVALAVAVVVSRSSSRSIVVVVVVVVEAVAVVVVVVAVTTSMLRNIFCWKGFGPVTGPPSFPGANFQQMVIARLSVGLWFLGLRNFLKLCHDEKSCTWWLGEKKAWDLFNQDWPGCSIMNMMHWKVIVFWGGPYRFTAFRACPMSFSTPPY